MSRLRRAVEAYVAERGMLLDPYKARDQCQTESAAFMEALADCGIPATVVNGLRLDGSTVVAGHFAVRVGDTVWDWTARQFDPAAPVPLLTPWDEWRATWKDAAEGWFDPLDLLCECPVHRERLRERFDAEQAREAIELPAAGVDAGSYTAV